MARLLLSLFVCLYFAGSAIAQTQNQNADPKLMDKLCFLETKYFEHTFDKDPLDNRVCRLEALMFGQAKQGTDLERISSMVKILTAEGEIPDSWDKAPISTTKTVVSAPTDSSAGVGDYPHLNVLEKEILGRTYTSELPSNRLSRLENKAFGRIATDNDLSKRTDALELYAEKQLHDKPFGINPEMEESADAVLSPIRAPYPRRERLTVTSASTNNNPEIFQNNPPGTTAQMLVRVSWCEQHALGKTFPNEHLIKRLRQLNDVLFPAQKESNMQLLDQVDAMVNEVVARQKRNLQATNSDSLKH